MHILTANKDYMHCKIFDESKIKISVKKQINYKYHILLFASYFSLFLESCLYLLHKHVPQHNLLSVDSDHHGVQPHTDQHQASTRHCLTSKEQLWWISTGNLSSKGIMSGTQCRLCYIVTDRISSHNTIFNLKPTHQQNCLFFKLSHVILWSQGVFSAF